MNIVLFVLALGLTSVIGQGKNPHGQLDLHDDFERRLFPKLMNVGKKWYKFKCTSENQVVPSPTSLSEYLICKYRKSGKLLPVKMNCGYDKVFDEPSSMCQTLLGGGKVNCALMKSKCDRNRQGLYPHPNATKTNMYLQCNPHSMYIMKCMKGGFFFDPALKKCVHRHLPTIVIRNDFPGNVPIIECEQPGIIVKAHNLPDRCYYNCLLATDKYELIIACSNITSTTSNTKPTKTTAGTGTTPTGGTGTTKPGETTTAGGTGTTKPGETTTAGTKITPTGGTATTKTGHTTASGGIDMTDPRSGEDTTTTATTVDLDFQCTKEGNFRIGYTCTKFVSCRAYFGTFVAALRTCNTCTKFNGNTAKCDFPDNVSECAEDDGKEGRECTAVGLYNVPHFCNKFYNCTTNAATGKIDLKVQQCPPNTKFSAEDQKCTASSDCLPYKPNCVDGYEFIVDQYKCDKAYFCKKSKIDRTINCPRGYIYETHMVHNKDLRCVLQEKSSVCSDIPFRRRR
ncbi:PREDICTED: uncharacterized protein LOC108556282 [Nicrophorus vespilloides]|uniref:Uncharacterized protein LOC108556282 n=1 Tax=Nicrophorus vespilloides TaxID=110193 RepID=A0ABM1LZP1_NICVS|nr:PREDICTED: uncharacterized protein LOC108556282 [Nicrophorus vespilloides]